MDSIAIQDLLCHVRESGYQGSDDDFAAAIRTLYFESDLRKICLQNSTVTGFNDLFDRFCALGRRHFNEAGSHVVGYGRWHVAFAVRKAGKKPHQVKSVVLRTSAGRAEVQLSVEHFNGKMRYYTIPLRA